MKKVLLNIFDEKNQFNIIVFVGILFFFHHLSEPGFFLDGMIYAAMSKNAALGGHWFVPHLTDSMFARFHDHTPFIIILQGLFFKIFGASYLSARLFINIFSLLTLVLMFKTTKYIWDNTFKNAAFYSAFFFLISLPLLKQSRFPNFDIPLMLFNFQGVVYFYCYHLKKENKYWYYSGIFFGLSMLTKGPMAVFVPGTIFLFMLFTKNLLYLKNIHAWLGLFTGFVVFSLWPMSLFATNNFDIFKNYMQFTLIDTISGARGVTENDYLLYFRHLFTFCFFHLVFLGVACKKLIKEKVQDHFLILNFIMFFFVLLLTSKMTFKFSHYIMSLYPSLAIIAGFGLASLKKDKIASILKLVLIIGSITIAIIPNKKIRDGEVHQILPAIDALNLNQKTYYVVNDAYAYWTLNPLLNFHDGSDTKKISLEGIKEIIVSPGKKIIFIKNADLFGLGFKSWVKLGDIKSYESSVFLIN